MSPSTLTIPCNAHRRCFFHEHHSGVTGNRLADTLKTQEKPNNAASGPNVPAFPRGETAKSRIQQLPHELLLIVFEDKRLGDLDLLSVALTCRTFFHILRTTTPLVTSHLKQRRSSHTYSVNEFLRVLVRDLSDRYWHCEDCEILHPRSVSGTPATGLLGRFFQPRWLFPIRKQINAESTFKIRIANAVIYALDFSTARAVIERHLQASKGLCLNALKCGGAHIFQGSDEFETDDRTLRYTFEPKIVLDRLLMKATYSWESKGPGELDGILTDHLRTRWQLEETGLWICAHLDVRAALEVAARHPMTREEVRCDKCPTQYWVQRSAEDTRR
ncbi:hypothetical protein BKA63DRAFT_495322 [Paraphoma chrysanthemicola]|nr:hypothetical protein BKA63DRAFT_495322 [Paraphoma chrysanthemicola]